MSIAYITEQGAFLTKKGERLVVKKGDEILQTIHSNNLEQLIITGNVTLTTQTIGFLLDRGIDTIFMSVYGKYRGRLYSKFSKNIELRIKQFKLFQEDNFSLNLSKRFVYGKLYNCIKILRRRLLKTKSKVIKEVILKIKNILDKLDSVNSIDELRGFEGVGAQQYFKAFGKLILRPGFEFKKRTKRPPLDRTNSLLSLIYTFLNNTVQSIVERSGMDPFLGIFHQPEYGRPSLGLDLMEEFRPILGDLLVLNLINKRIIEPSDFIFSYDSEMPYKMTSLGIKKVILHYERRLNQRIFIPEEGKNLTYYQILQRQFYKLQNMLMNKGDYTPFILRR